MGHDNKKAYEYLKKLEEQSMSLDRLQFGGEYF